MKRPMFATLAALSPLAAAQQVVATLEGSAPDQWYGAAVADAGDVDVDGYDDLLVGATGWNGGRGRVEIVSGEFLALGTGPSLIWSLSPVSLSPGDHFGHAIAVLGDVTGDGRRDFAVGAPDKAYGAALRAGAVYLIDGATLSAAAPVLGTVPESKFGSALSSCGDFDGDARAELLVGAPGGTSDFACVIRGSYLVVGGPYSGGGMFRFVNGGSVGLGIGTSVAAGVDLDLNGTEELLVSWPKYSNLTGQMLGGFTVFSVSGGTFWQLSNIDGEDDGAHFGASLAVGDDFDGDSIRDVIVGAPLDDVGAVDKGRVVVLSGIGVLTTSTWTAIYDRRPTANTSTVGARFGATVAASDDLNGDGVGDFLVGGPGFGANDNGRLWVYSGATGQPLGTHNGSTNERLGDAVLGAYEDFDGDGYPEFGVAGSLADGGGGSASGRLKLLRLFPANEWVFCVGQTNSLGCAPAIHGSVGFASLSSPDPYWITATDVIAQKSGMLFYGYDSTHAPFHGGTLCVAPPLVRTPVQSSGGSATGDDCTGSFAFDFNAWLDASVDSNLVIGRSVCAQYWSRDPQAVGTISLSEALGFLVNP